MRRRAGGVVRVLIAIDLLLALSAGVSLAMQPQVLRIFDCMRPNLNDPPCDPVVISSGVGPLASFAAALLIASPALLAGWWWWVHRA